MLPPPPPPGLDARYRQLLQMQLRANPLTDIAYLRRCRWEWSRIFRQAVDNHDQETAAFASRVLQWLGESHQPHFR
jgi:hypothetical protein